MTTAATCDRDVILHVANAYCPRAMKLLTLMPADVGHVMLDLGPTTSSDEHLRRLHDFLGFRALHWVGGFYGPVPDNVRRVSLLDRPDLLRAPDNLGDLLLDERVRHVVFHFGGAAQSVFALDTTNLFHATLCNFAQTYPETWARKAVIHWNDLSLWTTGRFLSVERSFWELFRNHVLVGPEWRDLMDRELGLGDRNVVCLEPSVPATVRPRAVPKRRASDDRLQAVYMGGVVVDDPQHHRYYLPLLDRLQALGVAVTVLVPPHVSEHAPGEAAAFAAARGWELGCVGTSAEDLLTELSRAGFGICGYHVAYTLGDAARDGHKDRALQACRPNKLFEYVAAGLPVLVWNARNQHELLDRLNPGASLFVDDAGLEALERSALDRLSAAQVRHVPAFEDQRPDFQAFLTRMASGTSTRGERASS